MIVRYNRNIYDTIVLVLYTKPWHLVTENLQTTGENTQGFKTACALLYQASFTKLNESAIAKNSF